MATRRSEATLLAGMLAITASMWPAEVLAKPHGCPEWWPSAFEFDPAGYAAGEPFRVQVEMTDVRRRCCRRRFGGTEFCDIEPIVEVVFAHENAGPQMLFTERLLVRLQPTGTAGVWWAVGDIGRYHRGGIYRALPPDPDEWSATNGTILVADNPDFDNSPPQLTGIHLVPSGEAAPVDGRAYATFEALIAGGFRLEVTLSDDIAGPKRALVLLKSHPDDWSAGCATSLSVGCDPDGRCSVPTGMYSAGSLLVCRTSDFPGPQPWGVYQVVLVDNAENSIVLNAPSYTPPRPSDSSIPCPLLDEVRLWTENLYDPNGALIAIRVSGEEIHREPAPGTCANMARADEGPVPRASNGLLGCSSTSAAAPRQTWAWLVGVLGVGFHLRRRARMDA